MNLYFKHWKPADCDVEIKDIIGVRFGKHAKSKDRKYRAWTMDIFLPGIGIWDFTITDNHKGFMRYWDCDHNPISETVDWMLRK